MNEIIQTHSTTRPNKVKWGPNEVQMKIEAEKRENEALVESMTNWRRSQWGKAGYKRDKATLEKFANMRKP